MSGATLAMASAVESAHVAATFHGSHSTPDLLSTLAKPSPSIAALTHHRHTLSCKSLPSLPAFDVPSIDFDFDSDFRASLVLETKAAAAATAVRVPSREEKPASVPAEGKEPSVANPEKLSRKRSLIDRPRSWIPSSRSTPNVTELVVQDAAVSRRDNGSPAGTPERMAEAKAAESSRLRAVSGTFADFARRSWMSNSRSPSPRGRVETESRPAASAATAAAAAAAVTPTKEGQDVSRSHPSPASDKDAATRLADSPSSRSRALSRASSYLTKIKQRPQSVFVKGGAGSSSSLSFSLPNVNISGSGSLSGSATATATATATPPFIFLSESTALPRNSSQTAISTDGSVDSGNASTALPPSEAGSQTTAETAPMPRSASRDPLWVAFKDLDANFSKFDAKNTTAQRMVLVRATLVPFLRRYAYDSSNKDNKLLSPEDVERRAVILNKWWNGLLEMLDNNAARLARGGAGATIPASLTSSSYVPQPVAGVDRPTLLEAITMIMTRPEWRLNTAVFRPLADRSPGERVRPRSGTADAKSFEESGSVFLDESAEHNVRNMFVANLLTQMAIVVDKMSSRHAPLSLVNFSGKACAYAFFFVPGIADVLVRLWGLDRNVDLIRRTADAFGLPRRSKGESDDIVALFPPDTHPLGWSSVNAMSAKLRRAAKLGLRVAKIPWHGPWVSRWRGGDTDLLFIFCKYFFILADEFMPSELPLVEKARAPAFVLLHAQLLNILDSTIHRQAAVEAMMGSPLSDAIQGPDGAVMSLPPLLPNNLLRGMDENRIVILLRDLLSSDEPISGARRTFTESIMAVIRAATKKISRYDHNACFMLCDFMYEALSAFDSYYGCSIPAAVAGGQAGGAAGTDFMDWPFWLDVFKMILASNNTMSEIRMLSFVFSVWDIIAADPRRKEQLCLGWLLTEEVFAKFFNNWCPMVRAYYMRLLCWRVCRDTGSANELDAKIFLVVSERLRTVWSHYLWLKQQADRDGVLQPSTAPSLPQPGKRFMIVRTEINVPQPGLFVGFDSMSSSFGQPGYSATDHRGALYGSGASSADDKSTDGTSTARKRWSLFGRVLSFTSGPAGPGAPQANGGTKPTYDEQFEQVRRDLAVSRSTAARASSPLTGLSFVSAAPPPPPKASPAVSPSSDSDSSGSSPIFDAARFVFKFTLHNVPWPAGHLGLSLPPTRDRILTRPRLPAPAQARVSARFASSGGRSESPPPPAPGLPPPTRRISGLMETGLIRGARNANPAQCVRGGDGDSSSSSSSSSGKSATRKSVGSVTPARDSMASFAQETSSESDDTESEKERGRERLIVQPVEPKGAFVMSSKYAGRALAEWSIVVSECNSFVDRRREEGVLGLKDVEVPALGVEGLRRLA